MRQRLVALGMAVALVAAACSTGDGLEARQVRLRTPDQRATLDIDGCARDGDLVVLGASSASVLVQLLLVIDGDEVDVDASGITVTLADRGTLGAGDPAVIEAETGTAGEIRTARIRGDRIDVVADAERVSLDGDVTPGTVELSARCTAEEDLAAP